MKAIVASYDISVPGPGSTQSLDQIQVNRSTDIARKTLGALVSQLLGSFLTTEEKVSSAETEPEPSANEPMIRSRIQVALSEDAFARTESGLRELVLLRNNLVHHFLEQRHFPAT